jgi:sRNA-binding carbon storage regulator CsrA
MLCITIKDNAEFYVDQARIILKRDGGRTKVLIDAPKLVKIRRGELPPLDGRKA